MHISYIYIYIYNHKSTYSGSSSGSSSGRPGRGATSWAGRDAAAATAAAAPVCCSMIIYTYILYNCYETCLFASKIRLVSKKVNYLLRNTIWGVRKYNC